MYIESNLFLWITSLIVTNQTKTVLMNFPKCSSKLKSSEYALKFLWGFKLGGLESGIHTKAALNSWQHGNTYSWDSRSILHRIQQTQWKLISFAPSLSLQSAHELSYKSTCHWCELQNGNSHHYESHILTTVRLVTTCRRIECYHIFNDTELTCFTKTTTVAGPVDFSNQAYVDIGLQVVKNSMKFIQYIALVRQ